LVTISVAQVVANRGFLGRKTFGFAIFGDRLVEPVLLMQSQCQVGMSLPEGWVQMNGLAIGGDGRGLISGCVQRDAQIVISIRIGVIAGERLAEGVNGSGVLSVGIESEAENW